MALSFTVTPGYSFSASEKVTYSKLNLLGSPVITLDGQAEASEIADGAITTAKLASTVDINSKIADHNIDLDKLASGTHGQVLFYDSNGDLVTLNPGTAGNFLKTQGPGADPVWSAQAGVGTININQLNPGGANQVARTNAAGTAAEWGAFTNGQWTELTDPYYIVLQRTGGAWVAAADTEGGAAPSTPTVTNDTSQASSDYATNYDGHFTDLFAASGQTTAIGYTYTTAVHDLQSRIDASIAIGTFTTMLSSLTAFSDFTAVMATVQLSATNNQGAGAFYKLGSKYIPLSYIQDPSGTGTVHAGSYIIPVGSSLDVRLAITADNTLSNDVSNAYIKFTHVLTT